MNPPSFYRHALLLCWITFGVLVALWVYVHGYGLLDTHHWTVQTLDRLLYRFRRTTLLRNGYGLPLLATGSGLLGFFFAYLQKHDQRRAVFNTEAETFPQEERLITNPYSFNLPMQYRFGGRIRNGWINILQPFRGLLVLGSPGAGKSYFVIRPLLRQQLQKGFTLFVYDFKFDDLTRQVYNDFLQYADAYPVKPTFHIVHFDDLTRSQRCNPLDPTTLTDLSDAAESARIILLGLNRDWIRRQGDFFVESAINFLTALIWFLRGYQGGKYCTLPHAIELMQAPYDQLFSVLRTEPEIEFLINPFVSAYIQQVMPQLEGQVAGAKISLARLSTPPLYYILSGNDFTLTINDPQHPRIVCMGNTPERQQVYGAVLSLYVSRLTRQVNRKGGLPCSLVFDEFPTLYFTGMDTLLATARSNRVATTIAVQDMSQLKKEYGRDLADVLLNITGNVISGQVSGDSARQLSERFGRILQERQNTHTNSREQSSGTSVHLEPALPPSRLATLSAGELVGLVADSPDQPVRLKLFHGKIKRTHPFIKGSSTPLLPLPVLDHPPGEEEVVRQYYKIKEEVQQLLQEALSRILHEPSLMHLAVRRNKQSQ